MKKLIIIGLMVFAVDTFAASVKIPVLKLCANGNNISVKQRCGKGEVVVSLGALIGTRGATGQKGDPGVNGTNGTLDINKCVRRTVQASGQYILAPRATCQINEFVAASGCATNSFNSIVISQELLIATNSELGDHMPGGLDCRFNNITDEIYTARSQILCCRP